MLQAQVFQLVRTFNKENQWTFGFAMLAWENVVPTRQFQFVLCRFVSSCFVQGLGVKRTRRLRKESKVRMPEVKASRFSFATAT
jgi:hypothetical protein